MGRGAAHGPSVLLKSKSPLLCRVLASLPSPLDDSIQSCGFKQQPHLTYSITLDSARVSRLISPLGHRHFKQNPAQSRALDFQSLIRISQTTQWLSPEAWESPWKPAPFPHSSPIIHKMFDTQPLLCLGGPCHHLSQIF